MAKPDEQPRPPKGKIVEQVPVDAAEVVNREEPSYEDGPLFDASEAPED